MSEKLNFFHDLPFNAGSIVSKIIFENERFTATLFAFDRQQNISEHRAPFKAIIFVLQGEAELILEEQKFILNSGDFIVLEPDQKHALRALQPFKMLLLMIREDLEKS